MTILQILIGLVAAQRLLELALSRRNTRRLLDRGGVEVGREHYRLFVVFHAGWLLAMAVAIPPETKPFVALIAVFAALQVLRVWAMAALGEYWTTRLILVPEPPVSRGPYRFVRHPNYMVVTAEIAVLPMAFGALWIALAFTVLNALVLAHRVQLEERVLAARALTPARGGPRA